MVINLNQLIKTDKNLILKFILNKKKKILKVIRIRYMILLLIIIILSKNKFKHIAMANPITAPYGNAALQALQKLGLWEDVRPFVVQGENIGQTFQFVASRNANLGFVALSQVLDPKNKQKGKKWDVPAKFYDPLAQDVVILKTGENKPAVKLLWSFLRSHQAKRIIETYGYGLAN